MQDNNNSQSIKKNRKIRIEGRGTAKNKFNSLSCYLPRILASWNGCIGTVVFFVSSVCVSSGSVFHYNNIWHVPGMCTYKKLMIN